MQSTRATLFVLSLAAVPLFAADAVPENPTYTRDVAPIVNEKCVRCHRPNQGTPMTLQSYQEVRPWVKAIAQNVGEGTMPPWHAVASVGPFRNDRSLDSSEKATLLRWVEQGASEGDPADLPDPPVFPESEWKLGEPDLVVTLPAVTVAAGGPDQFENLSGKVMLDEDRWIRAVEILPGNPKVVHHVLTFQVKGFSVDPEQGWLGAWAAGTEPMVFPRGTARLMEKGANIIGDMHYHPAETEETDVTRIGLHFVDDQEVRKELVNVWVWNTDFEIPPGASNHEVVARHRFLQSGRIHGFAPHMHYRGEDFTYTAIFPDGRREELLRVEDYDFNWQTMYTLAEPVHVPEGTVLECVAHYDNSADNPDNPDPTVALTFGDESYDEMMIGFIDFTVDEGVRPETIEQTKARYLQTLTSTHPGEVYAVGDDADNPSPLHLPATGDGTMYLRINRNFTQCRVTDIQWSGSSFTAKVDVPNYRVLPFAGSIEDGRFAGELEVDKERSIEITGVLAASPAAAAATSSGGV